MQKNTQMKLLLISALIMGFVFGFDDKRPVFEITYWFINFLKWSLISFLSLIIFAYIPNLFTRKFACSARYEPWRLERFGLKEYRKFSRYKLFGFKLKYLPIGIILPILITLISNGKLFFVATMIFVTTINPAFRIGKKYIRITDYENAKVALISPIAAILLAVLSKMIFPNFTELPLVNSMLAISYMIPLPSLNGSTVFFGSKILYTLAMVFILLTALLLNFIEPISAVLIAAIFAVIITFLYIRRVYKAD